MPPEGIDSLNADSLKGLVLSLLAKIDDLVEQNKTLRVRIAELEGRAGKPPKTPTNSSLPPSSGQKANVGDVSATKKSRKGHPGVARELCANPDVTRDIYAERCATARRRPGARARL
jgi:transposase